ncbi:efflux RND transporter periplasmic adaptor subunit [uncultured Roseovarius sp.]|uniref:efflux RND transporter periplasmic adaptor subunit n=1 Tax=uncultured Roseovarius sp. TaxID=293344 RepID=UPI002632C39D|nr:efflux RND transporter periplasmic adaptor subunit [uncultured Roseovarius sp.]
MRIWLIAGLIVALSGCKEEAPEQETVIRGLKTHRIANVEKSTIRRFPAVLEPAELNTLAFEVGGKLEAIDLDVGQLLKAGDLVARIDPTTLELQVENAQAGVAQAQSAAQNAADTLVRQQELFERGATTKVSVDDARTEAETTAATLVQAKKALETAEEDLTKSEILAPFDSVVNSVDVQSYATVTAGTAIASIYSPKGFEVSFSVNFDTVERLVVGTPAKVRLADRPDIELDAVVSEIGSRADAVSSFPIVLSLTEANNLLKAGMAVEAALSFALPEEEGFTLPLSAIIKDGKNGDPGSPRKPGKLGVYVFDPASSTIKRRTVAVGGVRENSIVIVDGLSEGDLVASAGVSFLKDGQQVKLLDEQE